MTNTPKKPPKRTPKTPKKTPKKAGDLGKAKALIKREKECELGSLTLHALGLTVLPSDACALPSLRRLDVRNNRLKYLPKDFLKLDGLVALDCSYNVFEEIPEVVLWTASLQTVSFTGNMIREIGAVDELVALRTLVLDANQIPALPKTISCLAALEVLRCRQNSIKEVPSEVASLTSLRLLDLGKNKLGAVPDCFKALQKLKEVCLDQNMLTTLPDGVGHLKALRVLRVEKNKLQTLPKSLASCKSLRFLSFRDNPLEDLPSEWRDKPTLELLDLLDPTQAKARMKAAASTAPPPVYEAITGEAVAGAGVGTGGKAVAGAGVGTGGEAGEASGSQPEHDPSSTLGDSSHDDDVAAALDVSWNFLSPPVHGYLYDSGDGKQPDSQDTVPVVVKQEVVDEQEQEAVEQEVKDSSLADPPRQPRQDNALAGSDRSPPPRRHDTRASRGARADASRNSAADDRGDGSRWRESGHDFEESAGARRDSGGHFDESVGRGYPVTSPGERRLSPPMHREDLRWSSPIYSDRVLSSPSQVPTMAAWEASPQRTRARTPRRTEAPQSMQPQTMTFFPPRARMVMPTHDSMFASRGPVEDDVPSRPSPPRPSADALPRPSLSLAWAQDDHASGHSAPTRTNECPTTNLSPRASPERSERARPLLADPLPLDTTPYRSSDGRTRGEGRSVDSEARWRKLMEGNSKFGLETPRIANRNNYRSPRRHVESDQRSDPASQGRIAPARREVDRRAEERRREDRFQSVFADGQHRSRIRLPDPDIGLSPASVAEVGGSFTTWAENGGARHTSLTDTAARFRPRTLESPRSRPSSPHSRSLSRRSGTSTFQAASRIPPYQSPYSRGTPRTGERYSGILSEARQRAALQPQSSTSRALFTSSAHGRSDASYRDTIGRHVRTSRMDALRTGRTRGGGGGAGRGRSSRALSPQQSRQNRTVIAPNSDGLRGCLCLFIRPHY